LRWGVLLALQDPRVPRPAARLWADDHRWCGGCTQDTPRRRRLEHTSAWRPLLPWAAASGKAALTAARWLQLAQRGLSMATPRVRTLVFRGCRVASALDLLNHETVRSAKPLGASSAASRGYLLAAPCRELARAQSSARAGAGFAAELEQGERERHLGKPSPPGPVPPLGVAVPGAAWDPHAVLSSGVAVDYRCLSTSSCCASA